MEARLAGSGSYHLGEGIRWDDDALFVRWVDIEVGQVWHARWDDEAGALVKPICDVTLPGFASTVAWNPAGDLLVASGHDLVLVRDGAVVSRRTVPGLPASSRFNDGMCDPAGRFVVGTMALDDRTGSDVLLRLEHDGSLTMLDDDLTLSNGLGWSPDGRLFYSTDTAAGTIWVRDYDVTSGAVGTREVFATFDGNPDGLAVGRDGHVWVALWGAGAVVALDGVGGEVDRVTVGGPHATCPGFVGPGLDVMLVTTATSGLDDDGLAANPESGRIFAARVGPGLLASPWAGDTLSAV